MHTFVYTQLIEDMVVDGSLPAAFHECCGRRVCLSVCPSVYHTLVLSRDN